MKALKIGSVVVTVLGLVLLGYMVSQEGEPGLLPLALVLAGAIGFFLAGYLVRSQGR